MKLVIATIQIVSASQDWDTCQNPPARTSHANTCDTCEGTPGESCSCWAGCSGLGLSCHCQYLHDLPQGCQWQEMDITSNDCRWGGCSRACCAICPPNCEDVSQVEGYWQVIASAGQVNETITRSRSVSHSYSESTTKSWGVNVGGIIAGGFGFADGEVSASVGVKFSQQYTDIFTTNSSETVSLQIIAYQTLWGWTWNVTDPCGSSSIQAYADTWQTSSAVETPCCLPGLSKVGSSGTSSTDCIAASDGITYTACTMSGDAAASTFALTV